MVMLVFVSPAPTIEPLAIRYENHQFVVATPTLGQLSFFVVFVMGCLPT
jgi:hypothetical protein